MEDLAAEIHRTQAIARDVMSFPVRTISQNTTLAVASQTLVRYGHSALPVMGDGSDGNGESLVGIITRRDLDIALHHGLGEAIVADHMSTALKVIMPETPLAEIERLMVTYDIGRLPVVAADAGRDKLLGIVTRTDVLRYRSRSQVASSLLDRLTPELKQLITTVADAAEQRGWQLYIVGGAVRDLLLSQGVEVGLSDIDLVVDGFQTTADSAAGVELAQALQVLYPAARLQVHGQFQTAALLWENDGQLAGLGLDIATARTEFYRHPAANPEVESSSIRQDLYRRDFTINALAVRLTAPRRGELLDFFGGRSDLAARQIRVIHANSFIEDPTRIFRAARFAVRLGFTLEAQTERFVRKAIASGIYQRPTAEKQPALQTRLKQELKYILQTTYWLAVLGLLNDLGAMSCLHPHLRFDAQVRTWMKKCDRGLRYFESIALTHNIPHSIPRLILLELLLLNLAVGDRLRVATQLQLAHDSQERLQHWETVSAAVQPLAEALPSQVDRQLSGYDLPTLVLQLTTQPRPIRQKIWRYLTDWQHIKPCLDGNDLRKLGYPPGQQYRQILEGLRAATLDGQVTDRAAAIQWVRSHFY
jgi:tRNA nucleotidyltransferase (CCA-adding enzyme)